jgi:plastocyanin
LHSFYRIQRQDPILQKLIIAVNMQFSSSALALAVLGIGSASGTSIPFMRKTHFFPFSVAKLIHPSAQSSSVTVHVVTVGATNGSLTYSPSKVNAEVGSMIQFQFMPKNHTITQSNFDNPCEPLAMHSNVAGIFSGFMPVAADATSIPTYTIVVNHTETMWMYCSQGMHCQAGMAMVINEK